MIQNGDLADMAPKATEVSKCDTNEELEFHEDGLFIHLP